MPEFILDLGLDYDRFNALDMFTKGYVEAIFFTSASDPDDGDLEGATFAELSPETLQSIIEDCESFQKLADKSLQLAYDYAPVCYDPNRAGNDFWYTRNHHGTGFWDRGLGPVGVQLTADAHSFGGLDLYRGDDGKLYL